MPSWQNAAITKLVLPLLGAKRRLSYPARARAGVEARALRPPSYAPPKRLDRKALLTVRDRDGWPVYEVAPKERAAAKRVLYLHGGAYVHKIVRQHWSLIGWLAVVVPARCVVPIYPLAPRGPASEVVSHAAGILAELIGEVGAEDVVLMGDSAGGGMALAVGEELHDWGRDSPRGLCSSRLGSTSQYPTPTRRPSSASVPCSPARASPRLAGYTPELWTPRTRA